MHHGQVVRDVPDTRLRREFFVPDSELPSDRSSPSTMSVAAVLRGYQGTARKR